MRVRLCIQAIAQDSDDFSEAGFAVSDFFSDSPPDSAPFEFLLKDPEAERWSVA